MNNINNLEILPPEPSDTDSTLTNQSTTFKDKFLSNENERNISISQPPSYLILMAVDIIEEEGEKDQRDEYTIPITREDKQRIYFPWRHLVIIKLQGEKIPHQILKRKLTDIWKPAKNFPLIDLGENYFTVKF